MIFDYSYYKGTYGGSLEESVFLKYRDVACGVISYLTGRDVEEDTNTVVLRALCLETDCIAECSRTESYVTKESLGDYAVSYSEVGSTKAHTTVGGVPVSGEAMVALSRAGFLTGWV